MAHICWTLDGSTPGRISFSKYGIPYFSECYINSFPTLTVFPGCCYQVYVSIFCFIFCRRFFSYMVPFRSAFAGISYNQQNFSHELAVTHPELTLPLLAGNRFCIIYYNTPRACLLNRSPVPAIDLKSNRSGLWGHMLAELVVGWEDNVANIQTIFKHSNKYIPSRDMSFMSGRSVTFIHLEVATHALSVWQCCDIRHNFLLLSPGILWNTCSIKQPNLYYFETIKMTSQA